MIAIAGSVFLLQQFLPLESFMLVSDTVTMRPWTILTHIFLHASPSHLLSNMIALGFFGTVLERIIGSKKFLIIFLVSGLSSAIGDIIFYQSALGASGAVFGILGTLVVLRPKMPVPAVGIILPMVAAVAFWVVLDLSGMYYPDQVAHAAHLFGLAAGLFFGFLLREPNKKVKNSPQQSVSENDHKKWEEYWMKRPYPEERNSFSSHCAYFLFGTKGMFRMQGIE